ncbi:hypothetical protein KY312_03310 [Candidatus Woesearchaeota archaeon]|nr:hypothetical protein [Candidatus Woesearchaeota archaeon]
MLGYNSKGRESCEPLYVNKALGKTPEKHDSISSTLRDVGNYKGVMNHTGEEGLKIDYLSPGKGVIQPKFDIGTNPKKIEAPALKDFYCSTDPRI